MAFDWKGYTWDERDGGNRGNPGLADWSAANVTVSTPSAGNIPVQVFGRSMDANQSRNAREVITAAYNYTAIQADRREIAARLALMCAALESAFYIYANSNVPNSMNEYHEAVGTNGRSVGIMQQQVGPGFQYPDTVTGVRYVMNVTNSTNLFLDRLLQFRPTDWWTADPGTVIQNAQQSATSAIAGYNGMLDEANAILAYTGFPVAGAEQVVTVSLTNPTGSQPIAGEFSMDAPGYGTYTCVIEGDWSTMHRNAAASSMIIYGGTDRISISPSEMSRWGIAANAPNVTHTYYRQPEFTAVIEGGSGSTAGRYFPPNGKITHVLIWEPGSLTFRAYQGQGTGGTLLKENVFTSGVPVPGDQSVLFHTYAANFTASPTAGPNTTPFSYRVLDFTYAPLSTGGGGGLEKVGTLTETFDTKDTVKWTWGANPTVSGGAAHFPANAYGYGSTIDSVDRFDLTASSVTVEIIGAPTVGGTTTDGPGLVLELTSSDSQQAAARNSVQFQVNLSDVQVDSTPAYRIAGTLTFPTYTTRLFSTHKWWRIAHVGTNIVWSASTNGTTWDAVVSVPVATITGFDPTDVRVSLRAFADAANTGTFDVAGINVANIPGVEPPAPTPISGYSHLIADDFTGYPNAAWSASNSDATSVVSPTKSGETQPFWDVYFNSTGTLRTFSIAGENDYYLVYGNTTASRRALIMSRRSSVGAIDMTWDIMRSSASVDRTQDVRLYWGRQSGSDRYTLRITTDGWAIDSPTTPNLAFDTHPAPLLTKVKWRVHHSTVAGSGTIRLYRDGVLIATITGAPVQSGTIGFEAAGEAQGRIYGAYAAVLTTELPPDLQPPAVTAPGNPAIFTATPGVGSVTLNWTAPTSTGGADATITAYQLSGSGITTPLVLSGSTLTRTVSGLPQGLTATYTIRAVNSSGLISTGRSVSTVPLAPPPVGTAPSEPRSVTAELNGASGEALVTWVEPATLNGTVRSYRIVDQTGTVRGHSWGPLQATVTGLANGTSYSFRVQAEDGESPGTWGALSTGSNAVIPVRAGESESLLHLRTSFGATVAPSMTSINALEAVIGQRLQPVGLDVTLGSLPPSSLLTSIVADGRRAFVRLGMSGQAVSTLLAGGHDSLLEALRAWTQSTTQPVFIAPLPDANDWRNPWAPSYAPGAPGYAATRDIGLSSVTEYRRAFDYIVRYFRTRTAPNVRFGWQITVDDQPSAQDNRWGDFYPGNGLADFIVLSGHNFGDGPALFGTGRTVWQTAQEIFDAPYNSLALINATKPVWLFTASHDPSVPFTGSAGAVDVDDLHSKGTWIAELMTTQLWSRIQAVVWDQPSSAGETNSRNWALESSAGSQAAIKATATGGGSWTVASENQDFVGAYVQVSLRRFANWVRSGPYPAGRFNGYLRPDAREGARGSVVFALPYSPGLKVGGHTVTPAEMESWNRLHGLVLRELGRAGMQGWAYGSGALAANDPALMFSGSVVSGRTVMDAGRDAQPGNRMQIEAGLKTAEGGTTPTGVPGQPGGVATTTGVTDATTQLALDWSAPSALNGATITGYRFGISSTADPNFTTPWLSGDLAVPPDPFVFTGLRQGTAYTMTVEARTSTGVYGARRTVVATTNSVVSTTPAAPGGLSVSQILTNGATLTWTPPTQTGGSPITGWIVYAFDAAATPATPGPGVFNPEWSTTIADPATRTYAFGNMQPGRTYRLGVAAVNANGTGAKATTNATMTTEGGGSGGGTLTALPTRVTAGYWPFYNGSSTHRLTAVDQRYNVLVIAFARPVGGEPGTTGAVQMDTGGTGYFTNAVMAADLATVRARGTKVLLSVGGASGETRLDTRARSQAFVTSIINIFNGWGGTATTAPVDGLDWNNFEGATVPNTDEMIWISRELKTKYGTNFAFTAAPAASTERDAIDPPAMRRLADAGVLDYAAMQMYDNANLVTVERARSEADQWVTAMGDQRKVVLGFMVDDANSTIHWTAARALQAWEGCVGEYPNLRGAMNWHTDFDQDSNASGARFQDVVAPAVLSLIGGGGGGTPVAPGAPRSLAVSNVVQAGSTFTADISWIAPLSAGTSPITHYTVAWGGWEGQAPSLTGYPGLTNFPADTTTPVTVRAHSLAGPGSTATVNVVTPAISGGGTPPPSTGGLPSKIVAGYWTTYSAQTNPPRLVNVDQRYNVLYLFHAAPTGTSGAVALDNSGAHASTANLRVDLPVVRGRGQKVILTLGGANATIALPTRTASTNLLNSIVGISNNLGGTASVAAFDGIDWNNFEAGQTPDTSEMIWVSQQLKARYGNNFAITSPPAAATDRQGIDRPALAAMRVAGVMDFAAPQFYDSSSLVSPSLVATRMTEWSNAMGGAQYVGIGFGVEAGSSIRWTAASARSTWITEEGKRPTLRGAFNWNVAIDARDGYPFLANVAPVITG